MPWTIRSAAARRRRHGVIKILQRASFDFFAQDTLYVSYKSPVLRRHKGKCVPRPFSAAGAADPVRVGIDGVGHIVIDDM